MVDDELVGVRFSLTNVVKVRSGSPSNHFRTPSYIQDKTGVIIAHRGNFLNPESLAHGGDGLPRQPLYTVEFIQSEVWPRSEEHTSELQSLVNLVCRLLLETKNKKKKKTN